MHSSSLTCNAFDAIPIPILGEIFSFLDLRSIFNVFKVCRLWNSVLKNNPNGKFWENVCIEYWRISRELIHTYGEHNIKQRDTWIISEGKGTDSQDNLKSPTTILNWKQSFQKQYTWDRHSCSNGASYISSKTVKRVNSEGTYPVARTFQLYEGGVVQVSVDDPAQWVMNTMSFGLGTKSTVARLGGDNFLGELIESYGYIYSYNNSFISSNGTRTQLPIQCVYRKGDTVGFFYNWDSGTLVFLKNGKPIGESTPIENFANKKFFVAVSLASDNQVTLLN